MKGAEGTGAGQVVECGWSNTGQEDGTRRGRVFEKAKRPQITKRKMTKPKKYKRRLTRQ